MGYNAAPLEKLIEEFSKFPGIGRKGATRMAYQVLSMSDQDAAALAEAIDSILSSEEIQRRYSQNCRQYIPQFEFEAVMQGYLQAIAFVTSGNK